MSHEHQFLRINNDSSFYKQNSGEKRNFVAVFFAKKMSKLVKQKIRKDYCSVSLLLSQVAKLLIFIKNFLFLPQISKKKNRDF